MSANLAPTAVRLTATTPVANAAAAVAENAAGAIIGTLSALDPNPGDSFTWTVSDSRFEVAGTTLKLKAGVALNHEVQRFLTVTVTARDQGGLTKAQAFGLAVTDVNEAPTQIRLSASSVAENAAGAAIGTLTTIDPDAGNTHGYTVSDSRFEVVGSTLKLKAGQALDFEAGATVALSITSTDQGGLSRAQAFALRVTDANDAALFGGALTGAVTEDGTTTATGIATVADQDAGQGGFRTPTTLAGSYGVFTFDAATGAWTYALGNGTANVQALTAGQTVQDMLAIASTDGTAGQVTVIIAGADDAAVIGGTATGAVAEDGTTTASGTLTVSDADAGQAGFQAAIAGALAGTYGSFTFDAATGAWTYALGNGTANVQALTAGQTVQDTLTIVSTDGTAGQVSVTVTGADDTAVIGGTATGAVAEDGTTTASGTLTVTDPDAGQAGFATPASLAGTYGSFTFDATTGAWTYALDNAAANVQALAAGQTVTDTLTVASTDGSATRSMTVSIAGADEGPVLATPLADQTALEGAAFTWAGPGSAFTDPDSTLTWTATRADGSALPAWLSLDPSTGTFSGMPGRADSGIHAITVTASDGSATASDTFTLTVRNVVAGIDLAAVTPASGRGFALAGEAADDVTGRSIVALGDVNGDGIGDFAVGSPRNDEGGVDAGAVYVVFGRAGTDPAGINLAALGSGSPSLGFKIIGSEDGDFAGYSIDRIGDVNGDGLADIALGADGFDDFGTRVDAGAAYVVYGKADGATIDLETLLDTGAGVRLSGAEEGDRAGLAVAAGDVNGDGRADLVVAAPYAEAGGIERGAIYVVYGWDDGVPGFPLEFIPEYAGELGYRILGGEASRITGGELAVGDVNGDGIGDILIYAQADSSDRGAVHVIYGEAGTSRGNLDLDSITPAIGYRIDSGAARDFAIQNGDPLDNGDVAAVGDVNGDGIGDLLVGAPNQGVSGGDSRGAAYVVFGSADARTGVDLGAIAAGGSTLGFKLVGAGADDWTGYTVATAGDLNGDGLADLLVVSVRAGLGGEFRNGAAYVVFGKADGATVDLAEIAAGNSPLGFVAYGANSFDQIAAADGGADVNNDGLTDLLLGTRGAGGRGGAHVVYGRPEWLQQPVLRGSATGAVTEDATLSAGGRLFAYAQTGALAFAAPASLAATYGSFTLDTVTGAWGYTLDNAAAHVQALKRGQTVTDTLAVTAADGSVGTTLTVTIAGAAEALRLADVAAGTGGFRIIGEAAGDNLGDQALAGVGDVNGDGLADILVGSSQSLKDNIATGAAWVVFGQAGTAAVNLAEVTAGTGGFRIGAEAIQDGTGQFVSAVGDMNGDGLADLLVSAVSNDEGGFGAGAAYIVFGKADGAEVDPAAVAAGTGGFKIVGESGYGLAGYSVAALGDVNGDGRADIVVGTLAGDAAYVVFGKADGGKLLLADVTAGTGGFKIVGGGGSEKVGTAVAGVGDVNGDGFVDILVGGMRETSTGAFAGGAYLIFGKAGGGAVSLADVAAGTGGFQIIAEAEEEGEAGFANTAGRAVSAAGDVNGDGRPDLLVGAWGQDGATTIDNGAAYVVFGTADGGPIDLAAVAAGTGGFMITGEASRERAGWSLASLGDLNGDGRADLLVGAPLDATSGEQAGAAYVVFGKADGATVDLGAVWDGTGGFKIIAEAAGHRAGSVVSAAGDVDGDGLADLLVSAPGNDAGGEDAGAAYVVHGRASWLTQPAITGTATGAVAEDGTLAAAGRVFAHAPTGALGFATPASLAGTYGSFTFDAATGAWTYALNNAAANVQALAAGQRVTDTLTVAAIDGSVTRAITVTIAGEDDTIAPIPLATVATSGTGARFIAEAAGDQVNSAGAIGDVNGDGYNDLAIGAYKNGASGAAYILFGDGQGFTGDVSLGAIAAGTGGFKISGILTGDYTGWKLRPAGDMNGDGHADILVTAQVADANGAQSGAAYVVFGKPGTAAVDLAAVVAGTGGFLINPEAAGDELGIGAAGGRDVNGDGIPDLLIGAWGNDATANNGGAAYVVFGKPGAGTVDLSAVAAGTGGYKIRGEPVSGGAGYEVDFVGDMNGDGTQDMVVSAIAAAGNRGAAYVVFGKSGTGAIDLADVAAGTGGFRITGEAVNDQAGYGVAGLGDVNGDGIPDVLLSSRFNDASRGAAYVVFGKTGTGGVNLADVAAGTGGYKITGEAAGDQIGRLSAAGDINGDGLADLFLGAFGHDGSRGAGYLVFGKADTAAQSLSTIAAGTGGFKLVAENIAGLVTGDVTNLTSDLNGDGRAELAIGSWTYPESGRSFAGMVWAVNSNPGWLAAGNAQPIAVDQANALTVGTATTVTGNLLAGATDADAGAVLSVAGVKGSTAGSVLGIYGTLAWNAASGAYTYTLDANRAATQALTPGQTGQDGFYFSVADGQNGLDAARLVITVTGATAVPGTLVSFETVAVPPADGFLDTPISENGFRFEGSAADTVAGVLDDDVLTYLPAAYSGDQYLDAGLSDEVTVTRAGGGSFDFASVWLLTYGEASIVGYRGNTQAFSQAVADSASWTKYTLNWTAIDRVAILPGDGLLADDFLFG